VGVGVPTEILKYNPGRPASILPMYVALRTILVRTVLVHVHRTPWAPPGCCDACAAAAGAAVRGGNPWRYDGRLPCPPAVGPVATAALPFPRAGQPLPGCRWPERHRNAAATSSCGDTKPLQWLCRRVNQRCSVLRARLLPA
jgi:hypothetical protein